MLPSLYISDFVTSPSASMMGTALARVWTCEIFRQSEVWFHLSRISILKSPYLLFLSKQWDFVRCSTLVWFISASTLLHEWLDSFSASWLISVAVTLFLSLSKHFRVVHFGDCLLKAIVFSIFTWQIQNICRWISLNHFTNRTKPRFVSSQMSIKYYNSALSLSQLDYIKSQPQPELHVDNNSQKNTVATLNKSIQSVPNKKPFIEQRAAQFHFV